MATDIRTHHTGIWNKAEAAFIETEARQWIYRWAQLHISGALLGNRFQVPTDPESAPYREFAIARKWISTEGYLFAAGLMVASRVAKA